MDMGSVDDGESESDGAPVLRRDVEVDDRL
jgi:hypothetical protein